LVEPIVQRRGLDKNYCTLLVVQFERNTTLRRHTYKRRDKSKLYFRKWCSGFGLHMPHSQHKQVAHICVNKKWTTSWPVGWLSASQKRNCLSWS